MRYIQGQDRTQTHLFPVSLDDSIDKNNEVRLIDLFVDTLALNKFGFKVDFVENGRPAYHPAETPRMLEVIFMKNNKTIIFSHIITKTTRVLMCSGFTEFIFILLKTYEC